MSLYTCTDIVQNIDTTNKNPSDFRDSAGGKKNEGGQSLEYRGTKRRP